MASQNGMVILSACENVSYIILFPIFTSYGLVHINIVFFTLKQGYIVLVEAISLLFPGYNISEFDYHYSYLYK